MSEAWHRTALQSFSGVGLLLGTLFLAASLTPSLVPRGPVIQGLLSGVSFAAGYGLGVALRAGWLALQLPVFRGRWRQISLLAAVTACAIVAGLAFWRAAAWQNRLRALMEMPPIEATHPATVLGTTLAVFLVSCTRFLWTPICPRRDGNDDVQHEADRRSFGR